MFTGSLKDRAAKERVARESAPRDLIVAEQTSAALLASCEWRGYALSRRCELGRYFIDPDLIDCCSANERLTCALASTARVDKALRPVGAVINVGTKTVAISPRLE